MPRASRTPRSRNFEDADKERGLFHESLAAHSVRAKFFNNEAHSILAVGEKMLDGELEYHKGNYEAAFAHLRESVSHGTTIWSTSSRGPGCIRQGTRWPPS